MENMENSDSAKNSFEKKTERLDIRVSHKKKQAFTKACENQGDTPSHAVRRFIATYTRRAKHDDFGAIVRKISWKRIAIFSVAIIALGYGGLTLKNYTSQAQAIRTANKVYNIYDENKNGLIELGEIAPNDFHLHRVLNIDGEDGISRDEFVSNATMIWRFVNPDNFKVIKNQNGRFIQRSVTTHIMPIVHEGKMKTPSLDPNMKKYIMVDGVAVELNGDETILENLGSIEGNYENRREQKNLPNFSVEHLKKYNTKVVKFDLRNPDRLEFTVYEQQLHGFTGRSLSTYQRSVTWVDGRKTPELVMGMGRDKAVLTKTLKMDKIE